MFNDLFKGIGIGMGLVLATVGLVAYSLRKNYVPMKDRPLGEDEWGEWIYVPQDTDIHINTTLN